MKFRKVIAVVTCAALAMSLALVGCSSGSGSSSESSSESSSSQQSSSTSAEKETIKVGLYSGSYLSVPVWVAKDKGYFEEEGLEVDWQDISTDGTAMVGTGDLDVYCTGYSSALAAIAKGETNITLIGGEMSEGCDYVVRDNFEKDAISSAADLEGLKIGVCVGDPGYYKTQALCKTEGVDAEFVEFDSIGSTITALTKKEVDLSIVCGANSYNAIQDGCKVLAKVSDLTGTFPCCRLQCNTEYLNNNSSAVTKFMRACLRGYETYLNDPDGVSQILADVSSQDADDVKVRMYGTDEYDTPMKVSIDPEADAVLAANEDFVTAGTVEESDVDVKTYINVTPYQEALQSLIDEDPSNTLWTDLMTQFQVGNSSVL